MCSCPREHLKGQHWDHTCSHRYRYDHNLLYDNMKMITTTKVLYPVKSKLSNTSFNVKYVPSRKITTWITGRKKVQDNNKYVLNIHLIIRLYHIVRVDIILKFWLTAQDYGMINGPLQCRKKRRERCILFDFCKKKEAGNPNLYLIRLFPQFWLYKP